MDLRPFWPNHPGSPYAYMQAHEPIRQQTKVVGHAVRAMYLFAAAVGLALEDGDDGKLLHDVRTPMEQDEVVRAEALHHRWNRFGVGE